MRRIRLVLTLVLITLAAAPVSATPFTADPATRWPVCGQWRWVTTHQATGQAKDVAVVSPYEAWTVGYDGEDDGYRALILHWNRIRWERMSIPAPRLMSTGLEAVTVVSPDEVWAVGFSQVWKENWGQLPNRPFATRWNGHAWARVPLGIPDLHGWLNGVAAIPGTDDLWAVGTSVIPKTGHLRTLALRWDGEVWRRVASPGWGSDFEDVVTVGATAWAVGHVDDADGVTRTLMSRWTGERWTIVTGPPGHLEAVDAVSANRVFAVGTYQKTDGTWKGALVMRRDADGWSVARKIPGHLDLMEVVVPSLTDAWAVGARVDTAAGWIETPLLLRRHGGPWSVVPAPAKVGWFPAIDGTPHNLWMPRVRTSEVGSARVDMLHRC